MNITLINENGSDQFIFSNVGNMAGFEYPTTRVSVEDVAGPLSALYIASKAGRRRLAWEAVIEQNHATYDVHQLNLVARQGGLKTIKFTACEIALQAEVEIENILMPYRDSARRVCHVEAIAPDWRFYGQTAAAVAVAVGADEDAINNGNEVTYPVFTITGPGVGISVTHDDLAETFDIDDLAAGEVVVVDIFNRTVEKDGSPDETVFTGDYINLKPGSNNISFAVDSGSDVNTELAIAYRHAYNGI